MEILEDEKKLLIKQITQLRHENALMRNRLSLTTKSNKKLQTKIKELRKKFDQDKNELEFALGEAIHRLTNKHKMKHRL